MNLVTVVKEDVLNELRKGNMDVLKGLPPVLILQYGLAIQNELGDYKDPSPINDEELNKTILRAKGIDSLT